MLSYWILQAIAMGVTCVLIPRLRITGISGVFLMVFGLSFVNATVWSAALFFHIPENFSSQALVLFLSNGVIFWVLVKLLPGIEIDGILPALVAPVVFTILSLIISEYGKDIDWVQVAEIVALKITELRDQLQATSSIR